MAAYLPSSNVQAETIQTLHLMNSGYNACADTAPVQNDGNNSQHQHPFIGYSMPPILSHMQQPPLPAMYTPQQSPSAPSGAFSSRISPYTWTNSTTTNEVPFVSSSDVTPLNQVFASKYASLTPESQFSQFNMGRPSVHEDTTLGSNVAHALSLSLSPTQMPYYDSMQSNSLAAIPDLTYVIGDKSGFKGPHMGYATHFRTSSADHGALETTLHNYMNERPEHAHAHLQPEVSSPGGFFTRSKYLKAVQHLLNEVVSVEDAIKKSSSSTKHVRTQSWSAYNSLGDTSGLMRGTAEAGLAGKEAMTWGLSMEKSASCPDIATTIGVELTPQERQELQMKKAKLMAMLEEVDRRYRLYHSQMQGIVSLFESEAGAGAARFYTALALQTISRHFRCLRDAISGQVRVAGKGLGEEEQLSQHRALQQLHLMHQHAWRPQRGLPERAVSVLRAWLFEHFLHPYPKDADKIMLAKQTGLSRSQVSNWFINARVRLWKPMVEEMYQEESKEAEMPTDQRLNGIEEEQDELRVGLAAAQRDSQRAIDPNFLGNLSTDHDEDEGTEEEIRLHHPTTSIVQNPLAEATVVVDSRFSTHEWQGVKKARSSMESFAARADEYPDMQGEEEKQSFVAMRRLETQSYVPYLPNVIGATRGNTASIVGGNSVSLTLGLQRSEPLEAQHQHLFFHHLQEPGYAHGHDLTQHVSHQLPDRFLERGNISSVTTSQNYYSSMAATNLSSNSLETLSQLQSQKQLPSHVLHPDFTS